MLHRALVAFVMLVAAFATGDISAQGGAQLAARGRALAMFARSYYPGRSGQIMIVPRDGSIVVSQKDPVVKFMHGSPWPYDARIPVLFYGPPYVEGDISRARASAGCDADTLAIDIERLGELRHSLNDVARFLEQQPFIFAAFTEDEVRRESAALQAGTVR